jgi:hypothetical protein
MAEEKNTPAFGYSDEDRKKYEAEQLANLFEGAPDVGGADLGPEKPSEKQDVSAPVGDADLHPKQSSEKQDPPRKHAEELAEKVTPQQMLQKAQEQKHAELDSQMEQLGKYGVSGSQLEKATEQARQVEAGGKPVQAKQKMQVHPSGTDNQNVRARETTNRIKGKRSKTTVAQTAKKEVKKSILNTVLTEGLLPAQTGIFAPFFYGGKAAKWGWKGLKRIIGG